MMRRIRVDFIFTIVWGDPREANRPLAPKFYKGIPRDSGLGTDKGCFFEFFIFFISSKRSVIWKYLRWL